MLDGKKGECFNLFIQGEKKKDIASQLGVTPKTISEWTNSEDFLNELDSYYTDTYSELVTKALSVYTQLLDSENEGIRLRTASEILNKSASFKKARTLGGMLDF